MCELRQFSPSQFPFQIFVFWHIITSFSGYLHELIYINERNETLKALIDLDHKRY